MEKKFNTKLVVTIAVAIIVISALIIGIATGLIGHKSSKKAQVTKPISTTQSRVNNSQSNPAAQTGDGLMLMDQDAAEALQEESSNYQDGLTGIDTGANEYGNTSINGDTETKENKIQSLQTGKPTVEHKKISNKTKLQLIEIRNFVTVNIINCGFNNIALYCQNKKDARGEVINIDDTLKSLAVSMEYKRGYDAYFNNSTSKVFDEVVSAWKALSIEIDRLNTIVINKKPTNKGKYQLDIQQLTDKGQKFYNALDGLAIYDK